MRASWLIAAATVGLLASSGGSMFRSRRGLPDERPVGSSLENHAASADADTRHGRLTRRSVLVGGAAMGAGLVPLARAFGCTSHLDPCPAAPEIGRRDGTAGGTGETGGDRTPCLAACSEQRVVSDAMASDDFDACASEAGSDESKLRACADALRDRIVDSRMEQEVCLTRC